MNPTIEQPGAVYIQTRNDCNASCSICPQKKALDKFGLQIMPVKLFEKIISDLKDYQGIIGLFLQFEPLLDERLFDFIRLAKTTKAIVEISTNGLLLKEKGEKLRQTGIDRVYFNYGGIKYGGIPMSVIDDVNEFAKEFPIRINYPILGEDDIGGLFPGLEIDKHWASNRGGNVNVVHDHKTKFSVRGCQWALNIVADGDVILCCNDYMRENIFGNAKDDNVLNIWRNIPKHFNYQICRRCL